MNHQLISTGDGWRCLRCKIAWDTDEPRPPSCEAGDEYGFVTDLAPVVQQQFDFRNPSRDSKVLSDIAANLGVTPELMRKDYDTEMPALSLFGATGDAEYLKDDVGDRRFWPISDLASKRLPVAPSLADPDDRLPDMVVKREPTFTHTSQVVTTADPMAVQHGGTHYKKLVIQPTEFCMRNGLDFCIGSILKYVTRYRDKNGVEDLRKAIHFVQIRESFPWDIRPPNRIVVTMLEYVTHNSVRPDDAEALYRLEAYYNADGASADRVGAQRLIAAIEKLIA